MCEMPFFLKKQSFIMFQLKRNIFGINLFLRVLDGRRRISSGSLGRGGRRGCGSLGSARCARSGSLGPKLHGVGNNLGAVVLLAVRAVPRSGLDAALDEHALPLLEVGRAVLGGAAEDDDVVVVNGLLLSPSLLVLPDAVRGNRERADLGARGQGAGLRVAGQVADERGAVEVHNRY